MEPMQREREPIQVCAVQDCATRADGDVEVLAYGMLINVLVCEPHGDEIRALRRLAMAIADMGLDATEILAAVQRGDIDWLRETWEEHKRKKALVS